MTCASQLHHSCPTKLEKGLKSIANSIVVLRGEAGCVEIDMYEFSCYNLTCLIQAITLASGYHKDEWFDLHSTYREVSA